MPQQKLYGTCSPVVWGMDISIQTLPGPGSLMFDHVLGRILELQDETPELALRVMIGTPSKASLAMDELMAVYQQVARAVEFRKVKHVQNGRQMPYGVLVLHSY